MPYNKLYGILDTSMWAFNVEMDRSTWKVINRLDLKGDSLEILSRTFLSLSNILREINLMNFTPKYYLVKLNQFQAQFNTTIKL